MKNLKKTLSLIVAIILILLAIFLFGKYNRFKWVDKNEKVVIAAVYDSLVAIANRPPIVVRDTIRDTIIIKIPEIDTVYISEVDIVNDVDSIESKNIAIDTLRTEYFSVFLNDEILIDRIIRRWNYEVYKEEFVTTIEIEKPVLVEVPCKYELKGLYGGASYYYGFGGLHELLTDVSLLTKKSRMYSLYGGAVYITENEKVYPIIGFGIKGKFK